MKFSKWLHESTNPKKVKYKGWSYSIDELNNGVFRYNIYDKDGDFFDLYIDDGTEDTKQKAVKVAKGLIDSAIKDMPKDVQSSEIPIPSSKNLEGALKDEDYSALINYREIIKLGFKKEINLLLNLYLLRQTDKSTMSLTKKIEVIHKKMMTKKPEVENFINMFDFRIDSALREYVRRYERALEIKRDFGHDSTESLF